MHRSVSEPSIGTQSGINPTNVVTTNDKQTLPRKEVGSYFFEGRKGKITKCILSEPWNVWFKALVIVSVLYKYIVHLLKAYYMKESILFVDITLGLFEVVFAFDVFVHLLHAFWPLVRVHMRVYRRNLFLLMLDVVTLVPLTYVFQYIDGFENIAVIGRWLGIMRIYRVIYFFQEINENMRRSRVLLYDLLEHTISVILILHAGTCIWYDLHVQTTTTDKYHIGYPTHFDSRRMKFDSYVSCWYYCTCRFFNVIFGDAFPLHNMEKWLSSFLMLVGYVFFRYKFIGSIAWELVLRNQRMSNFVDRYHHMINYLRLHGAPATLVQQAIQYKKRLWHMKNGILKTKELQKLPLPLQMELIFDINVGHFHNTLLFRNTDEAFMRQISLLMSHQIYLSGQYIWSQGVVKCGMLCIKQGVIEMLSDEDDESPMIAFKEGTVLGELSLFYSIPSKVTVRAATYVEVQVLHRTDFMRVMSEHPFMLQKIREQISARLGNSRRRQEAIMKYDRDDSRLIRTRYRPMKVLKDNLAGVEEEDPTFVDDSHMYYKDENNVRQPKFTTEFLELYQMTNNVTTIDVPRICLRSTFPWILEPNTDFTHMFDIWHFAMVLYLCVLSPFVAVYNFKSDIEAVVTIVVMAGLMLNIYLQLTTAIIDKEVLKYSLKWTGTGYTCLRYVVGFCFEFSITF